MAEQTSLDQARQIVAKVQARAKEKGISIQDAAKELNVPASQYYRYRARAGIKAVTRTHRGPKKQAAAKPPATTTDGRGVNVRELKDTITRLETENAQLREELLSVLLENRQLRQAAEQ